MAQIWDSYLYVVEAAEAVEFKLVRSKSDLDNEKCSFHPVVTHQIFGDEESIFGYKNLRVRLMYTAGPMYIYLGVEYDAKIDDTSNGELKADKVQEIITQKLPEGCYFINLDEFLKTLDKADKFRPFGEKLAEHKFTDAAGRERHYEIYHCDYKTPAFLKFFGRLQTFVLWFIDAACFIDVDDMQWSYFVCYEKYKNENEEYQYATVGYTTIYEYYAYPQNIRPRISQMLVLPPFQKQGIGKKFLQTIYKHYQTSNVVDITVEDPSPEFQQMRNFVDASLCKSLKAFSREVIKKGFNKEMVQEARETYKLNEIQCRKIYEILRLYHTDINDEEDYKAYRLDVKRRLNGYYHKQISDIGKMEKAKVDTEWLRKRLPTSQQRLEQLKEEYDAIEDTYKNVVEKLRAEN